MSKKDYELLARLIRETRTATQQSDLITPDGVLNILTAKLAAALKADNPRFDQSRFFKAVA